MSINVFQAKHVYKYTAELPKLLINKCEQGYTLCIDNAILVTARGNIRYFRTIEAITNLVEYVLNRKSFVFMYASENK